MGNDTAPNQTSKLNENGDLDVGIKNYSQLAEPDLFYKTNLEYIIGGSAVLLIVFGVVVAVLLWRKQPRRRSAYHSKCDPEKGGISDLTKQKREKTESAAAGNNQQPELELVAFDAAPDIITAHDNDSIYETLDGRRAARARADNANSNNNSNNGSAHTSPSITRSVGGVPRTAFDDAGGDPTYDHLSRFFKSPQSRAVPPGYPVPVNRFADPEVNFRRPSAESPLSPRDVRSVGDFFGIGTSATRGRRGYEPETFQHRGAFACRNSSAHHLNNNGRSMGLCQSCVYSTNPPASPPRKASPSLSTARRTSLTNIALQNSSGGKKIVCQLTMVGVVENGSQVIPVSPQPAAGGSYFILEPPKAPPSDDAEDVHQAHGPAKFRIRNGVHRDGDGENKGEAGNAGDAGGGGGGGSGGSSKSEYFVLEPLEQGDELAEALSRPSSLDEGVDGNRDDDIFGRRAASHSRELNGCETGWQGEDRRPPHRHSFRDARLHSCPDACDSPDTSPTQPPRNTLGYRRSLSSPLSSFNLHRRHHYQRPDGEDDDDDDDSDFPPWGGNERKMNADTLKERIQRELRNFGLADDAYESPETCRGGSDEEDDDTDSHDSDSESVSDESDGLISRPEPPRPQTNEYFILEPETDTFDGDDDGSDIAGVGVFRFQQSENASPVSAPVLPPPLRRTPSPPLPSGVTNDLPPPSPLPPAGGGGVTSAAADCNSERPRFQRQYTTPALPPRNPQRTTRLSRGHSRSKSETPAFKLGSTGALCSRRTAGRESGSQKDPDEGPVVVSLKSVKKTRSGGDGAGGLTDRGNDSFRPRLKSESGILSERSRNT